jgi:hypothetical protein
LSHNIAFVGHAENHAAAFTVKQSAQAFHSAIQLAGALLEFQRF